MNTKKQDSESNTLSSQCGVSRSVFFVIEQYSDTDYKRLSIDFPTLDLAKEWKSKWSSEMQEAMLIVESHFC